MWSIIFAGGDCAEDICTNLREEFLQIENLKVCSSETSPPLEISVPGQGSPHRQVGFRKRKQQACRAECTEPGHAVVIKDLDRVL